MWICSDQTKGSFRRAPRCAGLLFSATTTIDTQIFRAQIDIDCNLCRKLCGPRGSHAAPPPNRSGGGTGSSRIKRVHCLPYFGSTFPSAPEAAGHKVLRDILPPRKHERCRF